MTPADDFLSIHDVSRSNGGPVKVLIAGGGIAALELLLALRVLARLRVAITIVTPDSDLAPRAMTVAEPFGRGAAQTHAWAEIAGDQGAELILDTVIAVDTAKRVAFAHSGRRLPYDILALTTGARRIEPFPGALTFGMSARPGQKLSKLVRTLIGYEPATVAITRPSPSSWPLPLYELALLIANELRERGSDAVVRIVTPESQPLELFGPAGADALAPLLDALGIEFVPDAQPRGLVAGGLRLHDGSTVAADHVVTLADIEARPVAGLPLDRSGFVPVDLHGRVAGEDAVYAAGEATSFPLRQGGLATQQADAVAEAIAAECGAVDEPAPFRPVLRGRLLTSGAPLYLQARPSGQSIASAHALWWPPEKVAGRYLAPYLATARPARLGATPLIDRATTPPGDRRHDHDAVTLALALADAQARYGNAPRALQALEAARALEPGHDGRSSRSRRSHRCSPPSR